MPLQIGSLRLGSLAFNSAGYDLLPSSDVRSSNGRVPWAYRASRLLNRRSNLLVLLGVVFVGSMVTSWHYWGSRPWLEAEPEPSPQVQDEVLPPLYREYHHAELQLPQHDLANPFAGGKKYMWVADHTQSSGWGNFMQDMIMNAQLVYVTGRSFVFDNYTWDRDGGDYADYNGRKIPSRIPLSALISGPIVGGKFADGDATPRGVVKEYWDQICPNKTVIRADEIRKLHGEGATAVHIINTWVNYIRDIEDPCLEVERHSGSIFHVFMFGTPHEILPAWPMLSQSPILQLFGWGSLAHSGLEANRDLISPKPLIEEYVTAPACLQCSDPYAQIDGLLAIHLRRGDFLDHCVNLGNWGAGFNAFNAFPEFPDPWVPFKEEGEERMAKFLQRCLPNIEQIVEKIHQVRSLPSGHGLKDIYIMSNGDREWLAELKAALRGMGGWDRITTSRDVVLTPEQKYVSHTMDMLIGQRAQVLIGNGFSSMTSNIAMLRMAKQMPPESTHMW